MFAFLLGFYDENPTIYLIVCCLALLLWIYFMYMELCTLNACDQHRLDMSLLRQQKTKTPTISSDLMCKEIAWIKVPNECNRFSTNIATNFAEHFFSSTPLTWIGFANKPTQMRFQNTGFDVRMTADYETGNIPFILCATIGAKYSFRAIRFLYSHRVRSVSTEEATSKNIERYPVNGQTFDMEMQLLAENDNKSMPMRCLIFSWFFVTNKSKNYSLEPVLKCLKFIRRSNTIRTIRKPFPLDRIVYQSIVGHPGYYGYMQHHDDSSRHEIYHQLIEANHLIPIGITQMSAFHKLAHHIECSVNERVRIENHSSNAQHTNQIS